MIFKETGFRPLYRQICALELNDDLRKRLKNCPDIDKASHAIVYGYIDPKNGFMLEVLGAGKQAPKHFHFRDTYKGRRISINISDVADVPFMKFERLEPRIIRKYNIRIVKLNQYVGTTDLEKSRTFDFLDSFREPCFPDDVRVIFSKEGLNPEECWVKITGLGDHFLIGRLLNQPYQDFGVSEGDTVRFALHEDADGSVSCVAMFNSGKLSKADLEDGTILKKAVDAFYKDRNEDTYRFVLAILRSSRVLVPCEAGLSEDARAILDQLEKEGKGLDSLSDEKKERFDAGLTLAPAILTGDDQSFFPVFSGKEEISEQFEDDSIMNTPFLHVLQMAADGKDVEGIVLNAFTQPFVVEKDLFEAVAGLESLVEDEEDDTEIISASKKPAVGDISYYETDRALQMGVRKMDIFNYALYLNHVPPIRGIRVLNQTGNPVEGLSLHIYSEFGFFKEFESSLPAIPSGKPVDLDDPGLVIDGRMLADLTESVVTTITVELRKDGQPMCGCRGQMQVLAYNQWQGDVSYQDLLPAFVLPNHPVVAALLRDTAERLRKWGKQPSLEGYQQNDPNRVRDLAAAAYASIQKQNIIYAEPPASFSVPGQRIRTPEVILEQRLGTCMDMTMLYAACLEAIGLHPLLVILEGHIFAGVWLRERSIDELKNSNIVIDNQEELIKRFDNGADELTFVECTSMCSGKQMSFEEAEKAAKVYGLGGTGAFRFAIDVKLARVYGVTPLPSRVKDSGEFRIQIEELQESEITEAPKDLGISIVSPVVSTGRKITSKRELWESKLLDLSQHNMLLNLPLNASVMPIMSSHIDELEDALADGHEFNMFPAAEWITDLAYTKADQNGEKSEPIPWLPEVVKELGVYEVTDWPVSKDFDFNEKFRQEFRNHRLYTFCGEKQLDRELTTIYRAARSSQQENGVSSLYLAIGLLRWFVDSEAQVPCYAPLILLPIEIIRKSAHQGYGLHARDEESHFNTTLLEMLKQHYNLEITGLDPLPVDAHGVDIKKTFAIVRGAVYALKGWDVVETCVIGNFSFAQFAMWNDIHTAGDMLDHSKVVRSLMKGHVDWDIKNTENMDAERTYLPITVDATQLQAIKMAASGSTFVLHGPPGTGKSQTITGMIANLMAHGKKVLFVAEKMAALSVVQRRLSALGIGDFCLELHSDKANKKQVLSQLDKALAIKQPAHKTEYEMQQQKLAVSRNKLDGYAEHLHTVHKSGFSLHDLIDLYETVRNEAHMVSFDPYEAGQLSRTQIQRHLPLLGQLAAAGNAIGDVKNDALAGIGLTSYSAEVRGAMRKASMRYRDALKAVQTAGEKAGHILGLEAPVSKKEYAHLNQLVQLYLACRNIEPALFDLLGVNQTEINAYFDAERILQEEEQKLLSFWEKDILTQNISGFQAKHEAAGKKFFGKASAMAAVVAELQPFALQTLTFDSIPGKLQDVLMFLNRKQHFSAMIQTLSEDTRNALSRFPTRDEYQTAMNAVKAYREKADAFPGGLEAIRAINAKEQAVDSIEDFRNSCIQAADAEQAFNDLLQREPCMDTADWAEQETVFCQYLLEHPAALKDRGLYNHIRKECIEAGLQPAVDAYENGLASEHLTAAYKKGLYYALITEIIYTDDVLSSFSGVTFNESVQQFKRLDESMLQQTKSEIFYLLASRIPSSWDSPEIGRELNLLRKAIGSNARGMSIRTLFERIPHILQDLCPCMLMSPNSVAQYLSQNNDLFDVVIFDEASQLPTCKAIGALARAENAVIVGDPKQMPPTSFFAGSGPNVEDLALDDLDSILDDALALGIPSQHLQWHYRSTHESLIAFSNHQFYNNKMYTFPSANDRERHVVAVHVDGVYRNSTNIKEAEAVVAEIVRRFHDPELKKLSIGVVTFNTKQQALVENLLAKQFQTDPELDAWANAGEDPLFIKNLENVQGDERDVILFSIGYGPDEKGRISMNFGPINQAGGGKRLNVAFSRARVMMMIFSSIGSSDIRVTENSPDGLVAFRDFLKFAEGHDLNPGAAEAKISGFTRAGIMNSIIQAITEHGFQCVPMVGHSDFHVDISVVDPYEPTKYLMGVLLDGEGYRQTADTRDREVAQINVLKNLGWVLYRVWTIDWWDNREKELKKLLNLLEKLKEKSQKKHEDKVVFATMNADAEAKRQADATALKEELEKQAAEVIADDQAAEKEEMEAHVVSKSIKNTSEKAAVSQADRDNTDKAAVAKKTEEAQAETQGADQKNISSDDAEESEKTAITIEVLLGRLKDEGAEIVDKRKNGGALWIIGGKNLKPIMQEFKKFGVHFSFKAGGGKATGGRDSWWAKTDLTLPEKPGNDSENTVFSGKQKDHKTEKSLSEATLETDAEREEKRAETVHVEAASSLEEEQSEAGDKNGKIIPAPYIFAELPDHKMSQSEYVSPESKADIGKCALLILHAEAPIRKDILIRKLRASFGVNKSAAVEEATEKALKAIKMKTTKQKGVVFCWAPDQDPKEYRGLRVSKDRSGDEICPQELCNAIIYVLQMKEELGKDDLIKEMSSVLGYKRLGKNLEAALDAGVRYARSSKVIANVPGGTFKLL